MVRRLSAFALAFVIVGTPAAATVCQAKCATHQTHQMGEMAGHAHGRSHASSVTTTAGTAMAATPQFCVHQSDNAVAVERGVQKLDAPGMVPVPTSLLPPGEFAALAIPLAHAEHSPPGSLALTTPLRV